MKKILLVVTALLFISVSVKAQQSEDFQLLLKNFVTEYQDLDIPPLNLSYVDNLYAVQSESSLLEQKDFFKNYLNGLHAINPLKLSKDEKLDYHHLRYEISINWERLNLELIFRTVFEDEEISEEGLINVPLGQYWYLYFLKKWLSVETSAEELMEFGILEIEDTQLEIQNIQKELGFESDSTGFYNMLNGKQFFMKDKAEILKVFQQKKDTVNNYFQHIFFDYTIPELAIELRPSDGMGDVPGYYSPEDQTFYFNLFERKYNIREFDWLYLHEGVPGHHFRTNFESAKENKSDFRSLFNYPAYVEGWAAYCEEIGKEIGLYQNTYDYLGKLEWDLIRSVRVVLDIGINYYGWTDEEALEYWKENIINQDDKAIGEINRMKRWPAQVLTYKVGTAKILELKEKMQEQQGESFNIKDFHDKILKAGPVPLHLLEKYILE